MDAGFDRRVLLSPAGFGAAAHLLGFAGPDPAPAARKQISVARRAMACEFSLIFPGEFRAPVEAGCLALDTVECLEAKLSVFRPDSDLRRINRRAATGAVRADAEVYELLRRAARLAAASGGAFDAAAGALVKAWGFAGGPRRVPGEAERQAALAACGSALVEFDDARQTVRFRRPGIQFNLGSIGKGYAIDRALDRIRAACGVRSVLMQGGQSSIKALGVPAGECGWPVEIGDPCRPGRPAARVRLRDRALGTSGAANQFFDAGGRRYGHVLDPRTGWPARRLAAATAIAGSAAEADALSTAFYVMGVAGTRRYCREHPEVAAVLLVPPAEQAGNVRSQVLVIGAADVEVLP